MQNALLAAIVASSNDAISSFTLDGIITSWNPGAELIFGYSAGEMIGQPFSDFVHSEKRHESAGILEKIRNGQAITHFETLRLRKDGSAVLVSMNMSPIYDSTGVVSGVSSIYRDMTEQKKSELYNALLVAIVESSDDAILSVSLDGIITSWNQAAERLYGYSADEMIGHPFSILVPAEKVDEAIYIREKLRKGQSIANYETSRLKKDGSAVPVSMNISPINDLTGALIGGSAIYRDISEFKKTEMYNALSAAIVAASNDAIQSFTLDGIITSWNPGAERTYGYTADEIIGKPFTVLVPSEALHESADLMEKVRKGQSIEHFETLRLRKDGSVIPVSMNISPISDSTGAVNGGSAITQDMTKVKRAEQKFHTIVESAPDAIVIVDGTGTIKIVNSQTEKFFGYRREEMLGQPVEMLIPSRFRANHPDLRDGYYAHPSTRPMGSVVVGAEMADLYGRRKDGREFSVEISLSPIADGDDVLVMANVRDATDHKDMVRQLLEIADQNNTIRMLNEMNELRSEFVAVVAHDLRSPMSSISGYAQEVLNEWDATDDAQKIDYLQIIVRKTEHLAEFVEDVLQVARIDAGKYSYDLRPFDIRSLVQRALDETAKASDGRRFELISPEDLPSVLGDEDRQWQVLTNLLSNAVKFSPADEPIVVELTCIDDSVQVAVTDRGVGIATDDLPTLFTKFGRVSAPGSRKMPGNGLGLYICKTLVEAQGGQIWCESGPGRGSTFTFTIPVAR